jgi:hypothetical protein
MPDQNPQNSFTSYRYAPGEHALDRKGRPLPGYSLDGSSVYERKRVRAAPWRLKEWDFYQIADDTLCLQLVIGHVSYAGNCNIALFDHKNGKNLFERGVTIPFPCRSMHMPESAHVDSLLTFEHGGASLAFETRGGVRTLLARFGEFSAKVLLTPTRKESVTLCTPFEQSNAFYYNEKVNLLHADVFARLRGEQIRFDPENTFALLDWGRGVWPRAHEWYWSSANTLLESRLFGFNLGCGFGDETRMRATENIVYYGNSFLKIGRVRFVTGNDPMQPWRIESDDRSFSAVLTPRYDRDTVTKLLFVDNRCHQMFGTFSGRFHTREGVRVSFENVTGFAEHAVNHW